MRLEDVLKTQKIKDNYHKVCLNTIFSGIWVEKMITPVFKAHGVTSAQYNVLRILNGSANALTVAAVQQRMLFKASNVTRIIDKLLDKHYIDKKISSTDKRVIYITISEKGKALLAAMTPKVLEKEREMMSKNLTEQEAEMLSDLMDKMRT
ncbi:MarR family winged helix-turn-helix transcriptional regulator [Taibaiella sp. KBW10]|uniref:MarR family winged helix-turn-helix transcriptional regulator n=1 Tax=Taibaiella sp. KBW10 TaxID=2153357 RepID=UPI0013159E94|nr:MarR family transcriptional regulator [Taibaiella sp. KBW10]